MKKKPKLKGHKNLIVYQKSKNLTVEIIKYFSSIKYSSNYKFIIDQIMRSVSSIGANIAEGYGRHYKKSYRHFLSMSRGSCFETEYWLEVVIDLKKFDNKVMTKFKKQNEEIGKILTTLMKKLDKE